MAKEGYSIVASTENISSLYPHDILFNAFIMKNNLYCRVDSTSKFILDYAKLRGLNIHNVKQGYAKCSVCIVNDSAAITSDPSLYNAMIEDGIDTLLIDQGHIALDGYNTGFIGGCSGNDDKNVYFSGNITLHPSGGEIYDFCMRHGKKPVSLSDTILYDIGSIFFI